MKKDSKREKTTFTAREVAVLIEELRSQFRVFGEGQSALRDKVDTIMGMVAKNCEDIVMLNMRTDGIKTDINKINGKLVQIEEDIRIIKNDIRSIKEDIKTFDKRISHLETVK